MKGKLNPADILSKHWSYATVWPVLRPLLFWMGNTSDISKWDDKKYRSGNSETKGGITQEKEHSDEPIPCLESPVLATT